MNIQHSEEMRDAIIDVIKNERALEFAQNPSVQTPVLQGASVGLTREMVKYLGEEMGADLIIREGLLNMATKR